MKKLFLFTYLFLLNNIAIAGFNVQYANNDLHNKYSPNINYSLNYLNKQYPNIKQKINIYIDDLEFLGKVKFSSDSCNIYINGKSKRNSQTQSIVDDFDFILLHEIGHCFLGKDIFLNKNIDWIAPEKNLLFKNNPLDNKFFEITEYIKFSKLKKYPLNISVAYSELFADVFALDFIKRNNPNQFESTMISLYNYRFENSKKEENYLLHLYLESVFFNLEYSSIEDIKISIQNFLFNHFKLEKMSK